MSPFDRKNALASALDRLALHALLFALCAAYFHSLWHSLPPSLLAGGALFILTTLSLSLLEKRTLSRRDRLLRERIGGAIAINDLIMMPGKAACTAVRDLLCRVLSASPVHDDLMRYDGKTWLIRCAQTLQGSSVSEGDVLAAHRARMESGAEHCALASTAAFSASAVRAAEWADPPVRLISGRQLSMLFGRIHPATDEEIARHLSRQKKPFSFRRIRTLALSAQKLRRYLLCAFLLLWLYLFTDSAAALFSCLLSFSLAVLCGRENRRRFRL